MGFLQAHEFYLSEDQCRTVNDLRKQIEANYNPKRNVTIIYRDLLSHSEMNDTYFLPENTP